MQMRRNTAHIDLVLCLVVIIAHVIESWGVRRLLRDRNRGQQEALALRPLFVFLLFDCVSDRFSLLFLPGLGCSNKRSLGIGKSE